jgi:hypothetical protein
MDSATANVIVAGIIGGTIMLGLLLQAIVSVIKSRRKNDVSDTSLGRIEDRLTRIEQAVDAMSVEVERISEGQRFTTRLLSERAPERVSS